MDLRRSRTLLLVSLLILSLVSAIVRCRVEDKLKETKVDDSNKSITLKLLEISKASLGLTSNIARSIAGISASFTSGFGNISQFVKFLKRNWNPSPEKLPVKLLIDKETQKRIADGGQIVQEANNPIPLVIWHGMGDSAENDVEPLAELFHSYSPKLPIISVQVGLDGDEDFMASLLVDPNYQINQVCIEIINNELIRKHGAFNCLGFSQGGQLLRAVIERCPLKENNIRALNYVSMGSQQQGVYGIPGCTKKKICERIRRMLSSLAYNDSIQKHSLQASYWHDPLKDDQYKKNNIFLADINNESVMNPLYKERLSQLENMVLVRYEHDSMVIPGESAHFGFFEPGSSSKVLPFNQTQLYLDDRIGLKELHESGRLHFLLTPGEHLDHSWMWFEFQIIQKFFLGYA